MPIFDPLPLFLHLALLPILEDRQVSILGVAANARDPTSRPGLGNRFDVGVATGDPQVIEREFEGSKPLDIHRPPEDGGDERLADILERRAHLIEIVCDKQGGDTLVWSLHLVQATRLL